MLEAKLISRFGHLHPRAIDLLEQLPSRDQENFAESCEGIIKKFYRLHMIDKIDSILLVADTLQIISVCGSARKMQGNFLDYLPDEESVINFLEALVVLRKNGPIVTRLVLSFAIWRKCVMNLIDSAPEFIHLSLLKA